MPRMALCKHQIQSNYCARCTGAKGGKSKSDAKLKAIDHNLTLARRAQRVKRKAEDTAK